MTTPEAKPELPDLLSLIDVACERAFECGDWRKDESDESYGVVSARSQLSRTGANEAAKALLLEVAKLRRENATMAKDLYDALNDERLSLS